MTNSEILRIAMEQSAIDCGCAAEDFLKNENVLVAVPGGYGISKNARKYLEPPIPCDLTSYGTNIVAGCDVKYAEIVQPYLDRFSVDNPKSIPIEDAFETPQMYFLNEAFAKYDCAVKYMAEYFLPDVDLISEKSCDFEMKVLHKSNFENLYKPEWSNALCEKRKERDVIGVGAYDGERLVGLAGASADCDTMYQIGIDVLPEFRKNGIASCLVSRLALEILSLGKVPFYCAAWSNVKSVRTAIKSGFRPAWVQMTMKEKEDLIK